MGSYGLFGIIFFIFSLKIIIINTIYYENKLYIYHFSPLINIKISV